MKKSVALLLVVCFLTSLLCIPASASDETTIFIRGNDFKESLGTWRILNETDKGAMLEVLVGTPDRKPEKTEPATLRFEAPNPGTYTLWALTRDFTEAPDTRYCNIEVNGTLLDTKIGNTGSNTWSWIKAGTVELKPGENILKIADTGAYWARVQGIILSTNQGLTPPSDHAGMKALLDATDITIIDTLENPLTFKDDKTYITVTPDNFGELGTWTKVGVNDAGGYVDFYLKGKSDRNTAPASAKTKIVIPKDGNYKLHCLSRDYTSEPGSRYFDFKLGTTEYTFGAHTNDGWFWETSDFIPIFGDEYELELVDSSAHYARWSMLIITDDPDFSPIDTPEAFKYLKKNNYKDGMYEAPQKSSVPDADRPDSEIAVKLNGEYMHFDVDPLLINDRTMVPFRAIFEALGCTVSWDDESQTATGYRNGTPIRLTIDDTQAQVKDKSVTLDQPATLVNSRTMVPLRFVSEALGASVDWNGNTNTVTILATIPEEMLWFRPSSFTELGTWTFDLNATGAFETTAFQGLATGSTIKDADASSAKPAKAGFEITDGGEYNVWVRSRDFSTNQQGDRFFNVGIDDKVVSHKFGTHGGDGYRWAKAPEKVTLTPGKHTLSLIDSSGFYARCDSILLCKSDTFLPPENFTTLKTMAAPVSMVNKAVLAFPKYATEQNQPTESAVLENDKVKVVFYKVPTSKGQVVQNEIYSKAPDGSWVMTNARNEELGHYVLRADKAKSNGASDLISFETTRNLPDGTSEHYFGLNPYQAGNGKWYVPTDYTQNGNYVTLYFGEENGATLSSTWTLDETEAPLVSVSITAKDDGFYSVACWEGGDFGYEEFTDAVAPFRTIEKRIHDEISLISEQFLFTPMGCYTLAENNKYGALPITKGVVVEPDYIPLRWIRPFNNLFGINMKTPSNTFKGTLFAPLLGSEASNLSAGETHTLKYRVISSVSDWFENYRFITESLYDVDDYRQNTYFTLNDAIFNTRNLMLDDKQSGWDNEMKGHYNMESVTTVSEANPMIALQAYLLSEDEEMLERRAIPTLAAFLTRPSLHFNNGTVKFGSNSNWERIEKDPDVIGTPRNGYNLNVTAGLYEMTRGNVPYLYSIGLEKGKRGVVNEYGSVANFSNDLNLYIFTGDKQYLDNAIEKADTFIEKNVYSTSETLPAWESFIYISYYPNIASLMDIYDVTKDKKYLDAAEHVAQKMLTALWVPGIDGEKRNTELMTNDIDHPEMVVHVGGGIEYKESESMFWYDDKHYRVGSERGAEGFNTPLREKKALKPAWISSRVGLGLEQSSTFDRDSANIIMQYWAGDFVRLSAYTGNDIYETAARNAIIGRFGTYSGYYRTFYSDYEQFPEYMYEGPDFTSIYWHHIPPFLAMLEEFLISQTMAWSDGNISFPALRQQGYAYFNSHQYGHAPGTFYGEDNMWPYLAENTIDSGNLQIDWMAAKKDGLLGVALMNESNKDVTTTVSLLEGIPGGTAYSGKATLFNEKGEKSGITVTDGKFDVTVPAKDLVAVTIALPDIKAPAFAKSSYTLDGTYELGATVSTHKSGKGYVLQIHPESYYAYVYITSLPKDVKSVTLTYTADGKTESATTTQYPYEFIVKVENADSEFKYTIEAETVSGEKKDMGGSMLMTRALSDEKEIKFTETAESEEAEAVEMPEYKGSLTNFDPFDLKYTFQGSKVPLNKIRFVVNKSAIPVSCTAQDMTGLPVRGVLKDGDKEIKIETFITDVENRDEASVTIVIENPSNVPLSNYATSDSGSYKFELKIYPAEK
ncbi:MAG: copper amine oxidase N-terminal domain-containing protein [Clostridia bacterium]|nr:copper amine oxidase N-terminal domain-containing protein [Clostridia bacterium]